MLKISIITVSYNSSRHIEQTIQSVLNQTYPHKEYIVIDGGSTDGTIEIIKKYECNIDKWISEPDDGIADAMNKGLSMICGDLVIFLHSDDYFVDENVLSVASAHLSNDYDIFLYNIFLSQNGVKRMFKPRGFNWWMNIKTGVFHQSAICSKGLFDRIGNFGTEFRVAMDYDFFLRAYRAGFKAIKINQPLSVMRMSGVSSQLDWPNLRERLREEHLVHLRNCSFSLMRVVYRIYAEVYKFYRYCKTTA